MQNSPDADIINIITNAIKKADRGYFFFADYHRQALNVLLTLKKSGMVIMPKNPSDEMIEAGTEQIKIGPARPKELIKEIYDAMVKHNTES
jgi:hypothetical protein